jgi:hypothetical protein
MESVSAEKSPQSGSKIVKQLAFLVLGVGLLYFAFRGTDFKSFWDYASKTDPLYLVLLFICGVISHLLRAWRWIYLLEPIDKRRVSLWNSFVAVIVGYAVNIPVPRGGEVARLVSISKSEKLPLAGVLPTMFIDRMIDLVVLGMLLGFALTRLQVPQSDSTISGPIVFAGASMCICSIAGLITLPWMGKLLRLFLSQPLVTQRLPATLSEKLSSLAGQFDVGTKSLTDIKLWPMVALLTPAIWFLYWLNMYLAVFAFHLEQKIDPLACLKIFTLGSLGVLVPTPGSLGPYHAAVKTALIQIAGLDQNLALAYVTVLHLISFILVPCVTAAICFGIQSMKPSTR